jgi:hypothetical protein
MSLQKKYQNLKIEYFSLLQSIKKTKGHIRAYVGVKTWLHERDALNSGKDEHSAHVLSFGNALKSLRDDVNKGVFENSLENALEMWRNEGDELRV